MFAKPIPGRTTAAAEGDVVILLIGMRINHFRGCTTGSRSFSRCRACCGS